MMNLDFLQEILEDGVREGCFPAAVLAVGQRDQVLLRSSAGAADDGTRFDIASMTKVFSPTMLALRAIESGDLTLDDPLSRFLPAPSDKADITIRHLMTHTGGFTPFFLLEEEISDPADAAACILRRPLKLPPGTAPLYSCMGYILLGIILETLYGAPLSELAMSRVFSPLSMRHTGYLPSGGNIAPTEVDPQTGQAWHGIVHDENARFLRGVSGNAGVFSGIGDCIRFCTMLACGGSGYLSAAMLEKALENHTPGHDTHRGLGFHLAGIPGSFFGDLFPRCAYGHTGFTGTSFAIDPSTGFYVVLLTNRVHPTRQNEKLFRFRRRLHNMAYAAFSLNSKET